MNITTSRHTIHLTYCLNIHPGESWAENFEAIRTHACKVRDQLHVDGAFGLGLRLGAKAAAELSAPEVLAPFAQFLHDEALYVFTVNGFPYGTFHGEAVKDKVYRPDWTERRRLDYTKCLGTILAALLPEGVDGSISTVPGTYRAWQSLLTEERILDNLLEITREFATLEQDTGRRVTLALEPEPDCLWDQAQQVVELFDKRLPGAEMRVLAEPARRAGVSPEDLLRRHLGVCLDTCHQSVLFESPAAALCQLVEEGVPIHKVQISAAPEFSCTEEGLEVAAEFVDPVYLHQSCIRDRQGNLQRFADLPDAIAAGCDAADDAQLRTHFHIPLVLDSSDAFSSTRDELTTAFWDGLISSSVTHVEVETYSFDVLPPHLRRTSVDESIAAELAWTRSAIGNAVGR